ncbi:MAG: glucose-6-phosphate isomerase, partial [Sphaerochaetaceae bacterium]
MQYNNLDTAEAFKRLCSIKHVSVKHVLDIRRINAYAIDAGAGLSYHYATMPVDEEIVSALQELANQQQLLEKYDAVLSGEVMNPGEKRRVLHHLTRGQVLGNVVIDGEDIGSFYRKQLEHIKTFSEKVRSGTIKGSTG